MAAGKSSQGIGFRGIARSLWIAIAVLMSAMLVEAWFDPPPEGFFPYARKMILTLIVCFVCAPYLTSALVRATAWLMGKDDAAKTQALSAKRKR